MWDIIPAPGHGVQILKKLNIIGTTNTSGKYRRKSATIQAATLHITFCWRDLQKK